MNETVNHEEAARERAQRLGRIADRLLEKVAAWVEVLDLQESGSQTLRQICATLKDLKDIQMIRNAQEEAEYRLKLKKLSRDLEGPDNRLTVTIEGGEDAWQN